MSEQPVENDVLTEDERNDLDDSLADSGCHGFLGDHPDLYAVVERIVREHMAQAWEACKHAYFRTDEHPVRNPYASDTPPVKPASPEPPRVKDRARE